MLLLIPVYFVKPTLAYLFVALVLFQAFSRELLAIEFALNRTAIAARYCVNKVRPALHCDGKCYFAKQLKQQEERESKSASPLKERLEMLSSTFEWLAPAAPRCWANPATRYFLLRAVGMPTCFAGGVFHPPQA